MDGKDATVIVPKLEEDIASSFYGDVVSYRDYNKRWDEIKKIIRGDKAIGVLFSKITHETYMKLRKIAYRAKLVDVSAVLSKMRMVKDEIEISRIKEACKIASKVYPKVLETAKEGVPEYRIAAEIVYIMQKNGAQESAFTPIVAYGENSALPHYTNGERKLRRGDVILMDYGAVRLRYNSDMTRTEIYGINNDIEDIYNVVLEAQECAINAIRAGVKSTDVDAAAREIIDKSKYKGRFIHSTGHGLGLDVHDGGSLSPYTEIVLEENMVFTVEPGVYVPGVGGVRIEDVVVVKRGGGEVLTTSPKELLQL
ncbi:MAG: aminopeptidase P family protein [Thermoplasmata archaeon]|nr:MAG: aminopeptidase P family protein [Thermoplasmata archaeon]